MIKLTLGKLTLRFNLELFFPMPLSVQLLLSLYETRVYASRFCKSYSKIKLTFLDKKAQKNYLKHFIENLI